MVVARLHPEHLGHYTKYTIVSKDYLKITKKLMLFFNYKDYLLIIF